MGKSTRLGELLVRNGYLNKEQLAKALEHQRNLPPDERRPIGLLCVEMGFVTAARLSLLLDRWGKRLRLGELLVNRGHITPSQLAEATADQERSGGELGDLLISRGLLQPEALAEALAEQLDLPYVPLHGLKPQAELARYVNEVYASRHKAVPIGKLGRQLTVAIADPREREIGPDLERSTGLSVRLVVTTPEEVRTFARQLYEFASGKDPASADPAVPSPAGPSPAALLRRLIALAVGRGATEIRFVPGCQEGGGGVFLKTRDGLQELPEAREGGAQVPGLVRVLLWQARLDPGERRRLQEGILAMKTGEGDFARSVGLHVKTLPGPAGLAAILRILGDDQEQPTLAEAGLSPAVASHFTKLLSRRRGVILIAGPPGNGKRTTLRGCLGELRDGQAQIASIEDPIGLVQEGVTQVQVDPALGETRARYLRSFLDLRLDAVLLDGTEDRDAAEIALAAGETGPLILSTIRATNATDAIARLLALGVDANLIASGLTAVLAQRLLRRNCGSCLETYDRPREILQQWFGGNPPAAAGKRGRGCEACGQTGIRGRVAAAELWVPTPEERLLISKGTEPAKLRAQVLRRMRCLGQDALSQALEGQVTLEEALGVVPYDDVVHARVHGLEPGERETATARRDRAA